MMTPDHEAFLDALRASGIMNMFGAAPVLAAHFDLTTKEARHVLDEWMQSKLAE